jgi:hypothetical protein
VSKKRATHTKSALDLPPVPSATRYINTKQDISTSSNLFETWVSDLVGLDFQEVTLPEENQKTSRFFKQSQKKIAIHLTDALFIPTYNRSSALNLSVLDDGIYITIHLAISSPQTLKLAIQELQSANQNHQSSEMAKLLALLIKLQTPAYIHEAFRYQQFVVQEILGATPWGSSLFTALLWELRPDPALLLNWQQNLLLPNQPDAFDKLAAQTFISLFASKELTNSMPKLASYSNQIIATGVNIAAQDLKRWSEAVVKEWIDLTISETDVAPLNNVEEALRVAQWLHDTIRAIASSQTGVPKAA